MNPSGDGIEWETVALADVADVTLGKTPKKSEYRSTGNHKLFKYRDIQDNSLRLDQDADGFVCDDPAVLRSLRSVQPGDVLVGASGHSSDSIGRKVALVTVLPDGGPHYVAGELLRIRPLPEALESRWAFHFFSTDEGFRVLQEAVSGVHLTNGRARKMELPIAPLAVQVKICDALDSVAELTLTAVSHLKSAKADADRFRLAVLSAACTGRLTADWRQANAPGSAQTESVFELGAVDGITEFDLPENWRIARVREVASVQLGGTPSRKIEAYWTGGVPWVSSGEVANCRITGTREEISPLGLSSSSAKMYPAGTVLIAMIGEGKTRGQSAILDIAASTNQNAAGLIPDPQHVSSEYLWRWALAQYEVTRAAGRGGNQPALNKQKVGDLVIALPPLEEQTEIVRRTDQLLTLADTLVDRVRSIENSVVQSRNTASSNAFRGELVSQ